LGQQSHRAALVFNTAPEYYNLGESVLKKGMRGMSKKSKKANKKIETQGNRDRDEKELNLLQGPPPQASSQKTTSIRSIIPILTLVLVSFAVYYNALSDAFVYDDEFQIVQNPWITDIRNIPTIFSKSVWSFQSKAAVSNYYRPLMHSVYLLDYQLFGLNPLGFHFVNILFHCGATVLVFLTIRRLLPECLEDPVYLSPAFIAAILFASHPIHTAAVTWIAGLPDVGFTLFYLLSFYLYVRSETLLSGSYLFSVACFAVAALFKEPALTLPAMLLAYDSAFRKKRISLPEYLKRYIPYLAIGTGYLALRIHILGGFAPDKNYVDLSSYQYVINVFPLFGRYLEKLVFPINLTAFYAFHPVASLFEWKAFLSLIATVAFVILALVAFQKSKVAFLGLMFVIVPLLPVFYIPALGQTTFADRYLYLPSVGYVLILAVFLSWAKEKLPGAARIITIALIIMAGVYAVGTVRRNNVWQSNYTLWTDAAKNSPDSFAVHDGLGKIYKERNMPYKAIEEFQAAIKLKPDSADLHNNLGSVYASLSMFDKALDELQIAITLNPNNKYAYYNRGLVYILLGQKEDARREFTIVLTLSPDDQQAQRRLREISR
jgi:tetratricopeptide (TPR) repeat protein